MLQKMSLPEMMEAPSKSLPRTHPVQHGKGTHVDHRRRDLAGLNLAPGFHDPELLLGQGNRYGPGLALLLALHDQVEGVIAVRTVLFTGVAGGALPEHQGIFAIEQALPLFPGRFQVEVHVLTPGQAIECLASRADLRVVLQFIHCATPSTVLSISTEDARSDAWDLRA